MKKVKKKERKSLKEDPVILVRLALGSAQQLSREWTNTLDQQRQLQELRQFANEQAGKVPIADLVDLQKLLQSVGKGEVLLLRQEIKGRQEQRMEQALQLVAAMWTAERHEKIGLNRLCQIRTNDRELQRSRPSRRTPSCRMHWYK